MKDYQIIEHITPTNGEKCFYSVIFEGSKDDCKDYLKAKKTELTHDDEYIIKYRSANSLLWEAKDGSCSGMLAIFERE